MSAAPESSSVRCDTCGASMSAGGSVKFSPLKCWRSDCPGGKPDAPHNRLRAVK